jgi:hypothetical protein
MNVAYLADIDSAAELAGRIAGALMFPVAGLALLIIGIQKRSAARKQAQFGDPRAYPPPGYPPAYPGPYQPGYPMPPLSPKPKPAGTGFIVAGVVLLVLGAMGIVGATLAAIQKSSRLAIGNCFTNTVVSEQPDWSPHSCTDAEAVLQYAGDADSNGNCPDGKQADSAYLSLQHEGIRICFAPNLLEGQCYAAEHADKSLRHADCTDKDAIRVVKRIDGSTDESACPENTHAVTYARPATTYCTERRDKG